MVQLGILPAVHKIGGTAVSVSANGEIIAGYSGSADVGVEAVRWVSGGPPERLENPTGGKTPWSRTSGISANGLVVVGGVDYHAFRWVSGTMNQLVEILPPPNNHSSASAASGDGSVVVGTASDGLNESVVIDNVGPISSGRAFIWTQATGMLDLRDVLVGKGLGNTLTGWKLWRATGISDDGNIIAGYGLHDGVVQGWVAALSGTPFPSSQPEDEDDAVIPLDWLTFLYFGLHESHSFLWHPRKGPQPVDPDPPPPILGPAAENGARWVEGAIGLYATEQLWGILSQRSTGEADLRVLRHDGRAWNLEWNSLAPGEVLLGSRGWDLANENQSGEALAVFESGAGTPRYRTYSRGAWSEERPLPRDAAPAAVANQEEGIVRWIELESRAGSDEIALAYVDDVGNLLAWVWDGSRWLSESAVLLANDVGPNRITGRFHSRPFDVGYETLSGALVVAWSRRGQDGFAYARKTARSDSWTASVFEAIDGLRVDFVDLAASPTSDLIAGGFSGLDEGPDGLRSRGLGLAVWDTQRWRNSGKYENSLRQREETAPLGFPAALGWSGASPVAICVYADQEEGTLDWARWIADTGWSIQPDVPVPGKGFTESVRLAASTDDGGLLVLLSDSKSALHAFQYVGGARWQVIGPSPFATELASSEALPFGVSLSRERMLMIGDPTAGRLPPANLGVEETVELLSFALVALGDRHRVEALAFALDRMVGLDRSDWSAIELIVDANANGTVDASERTTVAGPGLADPLGRLVFFERFEVSVPTHYVLRAKLPALKAGTQVTVSLSPSGVVTPGTTVRGNVFRRLVESGALLPTPQLAINDVTVTEGNSGKVDAKFTVSLSAMSTVDVRFDIRTVPGSARQDDFDAISRAGLTIPAGQLVKEFTVQVVGDLIREGDEIFFVSLANPINATLGRELGVGTISDDDAQPGASINNVTLTEGDSGFKSAVFTVSLSAPSQDSVTVEFVTLDGTAKAADATGSGDYLPDTGKLNFAPGTTTQKITILVNADRWFEPDEKFLVNLTTADNALITGGSGEATIQNDDPIPRLIIDDITVVEANSATTPAIFSISLSHPNQDPVSVKVHTEEGTARAGSDYLGISASAPATITFAPGVTSKTFTVTVVGDTVPEPTETFMIRLSMPAGATLAKDNGEAAILNDDSFSLVGVSINDANVIEGNDSQTTVALEVSLSEPSLNPVTVKFATVDGTATAVLPPETADYDRVSGSLTFAPGETIQTVKVTVRGDSIREKDEVFAVELTQPLNAFLADDIGLVTIRNDDSVPALSIADANVVEGNAGVVPVVFRLALSGPTDQIVTVNFATADGIALGGSDYSPNAGIVVFPPGVTEQFITLAVFGDRPVEPNETFLVDLTHPINATLLKSQAVATILNDDGPKRQSIDFGSVNVGETATRQVTIHNPDAAPLEIRSVSIASPASDAFAIENPAPFSIEPGGSGSVTAVFTPIKTGLHTERLLIASQDPRVPPLDIHLIGEGASAWPSELRLFAARDAENAFEFSFLAEAGRRYVIEYVDFVSEASWKELSSFDGNGALKTVAADVSAVTQRYYRIREE